MAAPMLTHRTWFLMSRASRNLTCMSCVLQQLTDPSRGLACLSRRGYIHRAAAAHGRRDAVSKSFYLKVHKFLKTEDDLLSYLLENKLYEDDHYIAFNKPVGIPMKALPADPNPVELPGVEPEAHDISIFGIANRLAKATNPKGPGNEMMHSLYSLNRECSGVILFAKTDQGTKTVKRHIQLVKVRKQYYEQFLAITVGVPVKAHESCTIHLQKEAVGHEFLSKIVNKTIYQRRSRNMEARSFIEYEVVDTNEARTAALVRLCPSSPKWEVQQVLMASKLAPILGDHVYSRQVQTVTGHPIFNQSVHMLKNRPREQVLPKKIYQDLNIAKTDSSCLPLHLHCHSIQIPRVSKEDGDTQIPVISPADEEHQKPKTVKKKRFAKEFTDIITISAPLPEFFQKSMLHLGLKI